MSGYEIIFCVTMVALIVSVPANIGTAILAKKVKKPEKFFLTYALTTIATFIVIILLASLLISTIFGASVELTETRLLN